MATPVLEPKTLTAADLHAMPRDGQKYELVGGELIVSPAGFHHEEIAGELTGRIWAYLVSNKLGRVLTSSIGYELSSGELLSPDVSFVSFKTLHPEQSPESFGKFAPDLAVEIISPSDSMTLVEDKVEIYLKNGTQLVWLINPKLRRATVYRADGTVAVIRADGALHGEAVLPGFVCALAEIL